MNDFTPISDSYWVEPGRLLAGEHPGHWDETVARRRITGLLDAGIRRFIDLSGRSDKVSAYDQLLEKICRERGIVAEYLRLPLRENEAPRSVEDVVDVMRAILSGLQAGERVYLHCSDGVGRTGMAVGCWLIERGLEPAAALKELRCLFAAMNKAHLNRATPANAAQTEWVERWQARLQLRHTRSAPL
jgi:protein tyrosine/serine phosphatase